MLAGDSTNNNGLAGRVTLEAVDLVLMDLAGKVVVVEDLQAVIKKHKSSGFFSFQYLTVIMYHPNSEQGWMNDKDYSE